VVALLGSFEVQWLFLENFGYTQSLTWRICRLESSSESELESKELKDKLCKEVRLSGDINKYKWSS
jgi:hypothetical protein